MTPADRITALEAEVADLEHALKLALHGTAREREEAESLLIRRQLRDRPAMPLPSLFDVAADICRAPFERRHFP